MRYNWRDWVASVVRVIFSDRHVWRMDFFRIVLHFVVDFPTNTWNSASCRCHLENNWVSSFSVNITENSKSSLILNHKFFEMSHILIIYYAHILRFVLCKETAGNSVNYIGPNYGYKIKTARRSFGSIRHLSFLG